jgi:hypothetical protein
MNYLLWHLPLACQWPSWLKTLLLLLHSVRSVEAGQWLTLRRLALSGVRRRRVAPVVLRRRQARKRVRLLRHA